MSAHTPGPWKAHPAFFFGHDSFPITGTNGDSSPFLCRLTDDTPNFEANARLIAAAPDLLYALREILADIDYAGARLPLGTIGTLRIRLAIAAIAKAEGKL